MTLSTGLRWVALWPLIAWAATYSPNEPPVQRDSDAIRAVLQEPVVPGDPFPLWVAKMKLSIVQDTAAVTAIDSYATAIALSRITGSAVPPRATVGDVVQAPIAADSLRAQIEELLASTLRAEPPKAGGEAKVLLVSLRNAGTHRVTQFDAQLEVRMPQGDVASLRCNEPRFTITAIGPGESVVNECGHVTQSDAVKYALANPWAARLVVDRIAFEDPNVSITTRGAVWLERKGGGDPSAAVAKAREDLNALPCGVRNACGESFERMLGRHPLITIGAGFAAAGALLGTLFALVTRRRWLWGLGLAGVLSLVVAGTIVYLFMANSLMALLLIFAGPVACVAFVVSMIAALSLVRPEGMKKGVPASSSGTP